MGRITFSEFTKLSKFGDLKIGDVFKTSVGPSVFIKVELFRTYDDPDIQKNAIFLQNGLTTLWGNEAVVIPLYIDAKVTRDDT